MVLMKCKECGEQISTSARFSPNCGARKKKTGVRILSWFGIILIILIFIRIIGSLPNPHKEENLRTALNYLNEINEVQWIEFDRNTVYIGFNPRPSDLSLILRGAALRGNDAIDFGVHVWAIDANRFNRGWRPGDGPYFEEVTARYGKIQD